MVLQIKDKIICIVDLGYVGYPLLMEFVEHFKFNY